MVDISVYSTVYNNSNTVERVIKQVSKILEKMKLKYEWIICDNFSNDGTFEKLLKLSKKYNIKIIRKKSDRGYGRNFSILYAKGKYLFYVDMDDYFYENKFYHLLKFYLKNIKENTIFFPFGFAKKENYVLWPYGLYGEDWGFVYNNIKSGNKVYFVFSKVCEPYKFKGKFRDERYEVKSLIKKIIRGIKIVLTNIKNQKFPPYFWIYWLFNKKFNKKSLLFQIFFMFLFSWIFMRKNRLTIAEECILKTKFINLDKEKISLNDFNIRPITSKLVCENRLQSW